MENIEEKLLLGFLAVIGILTVYLLLVILPVMMYTDAECLRNGYPTAHVTVGLERYCSTLDGAVTVKVNKL